MVDRCRLVTYLLVTFFCKLDSVVWYYLVDGSVLVPFGLSMADEDDEPWFAHVE